MKKLLFLSSLLAVLFSSCDEATTTGIENLGESVVSQVESVVLSVDGASIEGDDFGESLSKSFYDDDISFALAAIVTASEGCSTEVTWDVDGDSVKFEDGVVEGQGVGSTTITATSVADFTKFATIVISIADAYITISIPSGYSTTFTEADENITMDIVKRNIEGDVTWSSSEESVISIDPTTGEMDFLSVGKSTISAKSDSFDSNTIEITVIEKTDDYSTIGGIETEDVTL